MILELSKMLDKIFQFLKENRQYNKETQTRYYSYMFNPKNSTEDKVISLLYTIANTQSQPKIDALSEFYQRIYKKKEFLNSFKGFMSIIEAKENENPYKGLFKAMKKQKGWGEKTSALLVKTIYHLHNGEYPRELRIWNDVPDLEGNDELFIPADSVIQTIFNKSIDEIEGKKWTFNRINERIKDYYSKIEVEIWDDLWFWGFISQKGSEGNREYEWNENKYWALRETDKNEEKIAEIKSKVEEFLQILKTNEKY